MSAEVCFQGIPFLSVLCVSSVLLKESHTYLVTLFLPLPPENWILTAVVSCDVPVSDKSLGSNAARLYTHWHTLVAVLPGWPNANTIVWRCSVAANNCFIWITTLDVLVVISVGWYGFFFLTGIKLKMFCSESPINYKQTMNSLIVFKKIFLKLVDYISTTIILSIFWLSRYNLRGTDHASDAFAFLGKSWKCLYSYNCRSDHFVSTQLPYRQ